MPIKVKQAGVWKDAVPKVKVGGVWKDASGYVKAGGLWYQTTSSGLNVIIDSATTLYDFNLKTYMQGAGIWPASGPVVINEVRITARTVITQNVGSEVVDLEIRYNNSAPFRATPRGYKTYTVQNGTLWEHYNYQENPDLYPAFTTGDSWPVGSVIRTFIVDGLIYGKGADGFGVPKSYEARQESTDGSVQLSSNNARTFPQGWVAMTLRHGYPALHLTLPVTTLTVSGGVYGGGASSAALTFSIAPPGALDTITHPTPVTAWPNRLTGDYLSLTPARSVPSNGAATLFRGYAAGRQHVVHRQYGVISAAQTGMHGGGGGQGGGVGGGAVRTPQLTDGTSWAGFMAGREPLSGGNGSLAGPGAGAVALTEFYDSDYKYGIGESLLPASSAVYNGCGWGEELTSYGIYSDRTDAAAGRAVTPPTALTVITEGMHPTVLNTRTFFSKAGASILGASNVTSYTSLTQIKGKRL